MANEALVWKRFKRLMQGERVTHLERVEPVLPKGLPDVHYIVDGQAGWIELKDIDDWPKRAKTPLRIPHFQKAQRLWLWRYGKAGGQAFILVHVKDVCFLFNWKAAFTIGEITKEQILQYCILSWPDAMSLRSYRGIIIDQLSYRCSPQIPDYFRGPTIIHL